MKDKLVVITRVFYYLPSCLSYVFQHLSEHWTMIFMCIKPGDKLQYSMVQNIIHLGIRVKLNTSEDIS